MKAVVVGHVTKDLIRIPGRPDRVMTGGSAFYASIALARLGFSVSTVTKLAPADDGLLDPLRAVGVELVLRPSATTTVFENSYFGAQLSERKQRVPSIAAAFDAADLDGLSADVLHLGPLTAGEMGPALFESARARAPRVSFDAQGILRRIEDQAVVPARPGALGQLLRHVDILKVDDLEAAALVEENDPRLGAAALGALGPSEVLVTFADRGSLIWTATHTDRIAAIPPREIVDATGCGDTYLAGYVAARMRDEHPPTAARIAAAAASLKLEGYGPLSHGWNDVVARAA